MGANGPSMGIDRPKRLFRDVLQILRVAVGATEARDQTIIRARRPRSMLPRHGPLVVNEHRFGPTSLSSLSLHRCTFPKTLPADHAKYCYLPYDGVE